MKKIVVIVIALVCNALTFAQKAEVIETFAANSHEAEWYGEQAKAWQKKVDENPDESETANVLRKMEEILPDSYVVSLCKGRFCLTTDSAARRGDNIFRAIELMPEDANGEDVDYLACRLWVTDPEMYYTSVLA